LKTIKDALPFSKTLSRWYGKLQGPSSSNYRSFSVARNTSPSQSIDWIEGEGHVKDSFVGKCVSSTEMLSTQQHGTFETKRGGRQRERGRD
jgi:hypothetical protein